MVLPPGRSGRRAAWLPHVTDTPTSCRGRPYRFGRRPARGSLAWYPLSCAPLHDRVDGGGERIRGPDGGGRAGSRGGRPRTRAAGTSALAPSCGARMRARSLALRPAGAALRSSTLSTPARAKGRSAGAARRRGGPSAALAIGVGCDVVQARISECTPLRETSTRGPAGAGPRRPPGPGDLWRTDKISGWPGPSRPSPKFRCGHSSVVKDCRPERRLICAGGHRKHPGHVLTNRARRRRRAGTQNLRARRRLHPPRRRTAPRGSFLPAGGP